MTAATTQHPAISSVPAPLASIVCQPEDDAWDEVRQAWNLAVDQRPAAVALPRHTEDVIALVRWAQQQGLRVSAQTTGHGAAAHASLTNTLLIKTRGLDEVRIDAELQRARVGAGVLWSEVSAAAADVGLAALAGTGPDVGVTGYTLGGGIGWLSRRYGLASNAVLAVEVVTAAGLVRTDRYHEPELFWALRGGGGAFGVVTAIEFELYPVTEVYAGTLFWPAERAETVLNAWRDWTLTVPVEVTSSGRLLNFPPLPDVPEHLRGQSFVAVEVACLGDPTIAAHQLRPLRALGPEIDTVANIPAGQLERLHMDPDRPVPGVGNGGLLAALPSAAVTALLGVAGPGTESPLLSVELRHLGGALADAPDGAGALASLDAAYGMFAVGMAPTPERKAVIDTRLDAVAQALLPWQAPHGYLNFTDRPGASERLFPADTYPRLQNVKAAYDPGDVFLSNHPIVPGTGQATRP